MVDLVVTAKNGSQAAFMHCQLTYIRLSEWLWVHMQRHSVKDNDDDRRHGARCKLAKDITLGERGLGHQSRPWRRRLLAAERWWQLYRRFAIGIVAVDICFVGVPLYVCILPITMFPKNPPPSSVSSFAC